MKRADCTLKYSHTTLDVELDYAQHRVPAAPYLPKTWTDLLQKLTRSGQIANLKAAEPYRVNAIVYSYHNA